MLGSQSASVSHLVRWSFGLSVTEHVTKLCSYCSPTRFQQSQAIHKMEDNKLACIRLDFMHMLSSPYLFDSVSTVHCS
jgi:3-methyladenine DNA glycosylase AlkC